MAERRFLVCHLEFSSSSSILLLCVELLKKWILLLLDKDLAITWKKITSPYDTDFCQQ